MKPVTDEGFIEIGGQVAMPEETVADLLGVTIERLHELSKSVDMHNREGGIYVRDGKQYFASPQVIFKVRDANGKKSADLSSQGLFQVFAKAEARLLPEQYKAKNRRTMMKVGAVLLAIFLYANFSEPSEKPTQSTPPPPKVEQTAPIEKPAPQPPKVLNLGMTLDQFKVNFAKTATQLGLPGIDVDDLQIERGEVQDIFRADDATGRFVMMGTLGKQDGLIREIWILLQPQTGEDIFAGGIIYGLMIATIDPSLSPDERGALMTSLKLPDKLLELKNGNARVVRGNFRYTSSLIAGGIIHLVISPKDL